MVLEGRNVYSENINTNLVVGYLKSEGSGDLTAREAEVLQLIADGLSNDLVGQKLGIGQKAVQLHLSRVYSKLGVSGRTEAIVAAAKAGLIVIDE
jgi:DNA-binding NarL/FixJ family response regulator